MAARGRPETSALPSADARRPLEPRGARFTVSRLPIARAAGPSGGHMNTASHSGHSALSLTHRSPLLLHHASFAADCARICRSGTYFATLPREEERYAVGANITATAAC